MACHLCGGSHPPNDVPFVCHKCGKELALANGLVVGVYPNFIHLDLDSTCCFNLHGPNYLSPTHAPLCVNQAKEPAMTQPALTKEQASDLKSHVARVVACELEQYKATKQLVEAVRNLDQFVYDLQHPKQGA